MQRHKKRINISSCCWLHI